jgi:hypothetical protein
MASAPLKSHSYRGSNIFCSQLQLLPRRATTSSVAHPRRFHGLRNLLRPSRPDHESGLTPRLAESAIGSRKSTQRSDSAMYNLLALPEWRKVLPRLFTQTGISWPCWQSVGTAISGARRRDTGGAMKVTSACSSGADAWRSQEFRPSRRPVVSVAQSAETDRRFDHLTLHTGDLSRTGEPRTAFSQPGGSTLASALVVARTQPGPRQ